MRTDEEIIARIREVADRDLLGYERSDLLQALDYDKYAEVAESLGFTVIDRESFGQPVRNREQLIEQMKDYMPFAWDKANSKRSISAWRSMSHDW